jgi:hypothetical protein
MAVQNDGYLRTELGPGLVAERDRIIGLGCRRIAEYERLRVASAAPASKGQMAWLWALPLLRLGMSSACRNGARRPAALTDRQIEAARAQTMTER